MNYFNLIVCIMYQRKSHNIQNGLGTELLIKVSAVLD